TGNRRSDAGWCKPQAACTPLTSPNSKICRQFHDCCTAATFWPDPCVKTVARSVTLMAIPLAANHTGDATDASSVTTLLAIGPEDKARIRILVVDDEHTLRESCASVLGHEGYDVTACGRGQEALALFK